MPFNASAAQTTTSIYTKKTLTHNSRFDNSDIVNGIDISSWQGDVDFKKVKKTDTKIIILRVGVRGWASEGPLKKDERFDEYIKDALSNGFEVGVYFYSQAKTEAEAKEEAKFVLKHIKGYKFSLPVYFDYEFAGTQKGRLEKAWKDGSLNRTKMTKNAIAFCETIENAGYRAGIYACRSFLNSNLDRTQFEEKYPVWVAEYNPKTSYAGEYQIWQYAGGDPDGSNGSGKVSGISGYVDSNYIYYDKLTPLLSKGFDIEDIKKQEYTGEPVSPAFKVYYGKKELVKGEDYYVSLEDNVKIGSARVTVTGINKFKDYNKCTKTFSIVPPEITDVKLEERKTNSLEVSWDKSDCAKKYYVQVHRKDGWVKVGTTSETNIEIPDLNSASNYRIRVRAYKKVDDVNYYGIYSDEFETATKPAKPTELKTTSVTPTSFTLKWKKQSNASYYEVYQYNYSDKKYELFKTVNGGKNNYLNVDSLAENKKYTFRVKAYKKSKDGKLLKSAKSDKFYAYTSLRAPKISSAKSGASKRISVNWKKVSGASGYQVMWSTTSNFSSNYKSVYVSGKSLSTVLTTAQSNKTYYVKVRAFKTRNNKKLYSPWSSKLSVKTK
ncbi:MAG: fibronectin type III domain-containing protein [Eubacterium sp.]|nr:fibronectin type III domain-containing protein [Eubacterium sp.]